MGADAERASQGEAAMLCEICTACEERLLKTKFSKTQLSKPKAKRRCIACVAKLTNSNGASASETGTPRKVQPKIESPRSEPQALEVSANACENTTAEPQSPHERKVQAVFGPVNRNGIGACVPSSDTEASSSDDTDVTGSVVVDSVRRSPVNEEKPRASKKNTSTPTTEDCIRRLEQVYSDPEGKGITHPDMLEKKIKRTFQTRSTEKVIKLITRKYGWGNVFPWRGASGKDSSQSQESKAVSQLASNNQVEKNGKKRPREESTDGKSSVCDKCDGKHATSKCPHYKKAREDHPDAQRRRGIVNIGGDGGNVVLRSNQARVLRQPGDGSCLYHSLRYGLGSAAKGINSTHSLRMTLANWVRSHRDEKIADTPVREWVRWDAGCSVDTYVNRMRHSAWGGGIELAACARHFGVQVHVWERYRGGYKRISSFEAPHSARKTVNVIYQGGVHYDFLEIHGTPEKERPSALFDVGFSSKNFNKHKGNRYGGRSLTGSISNKFRQVAASSRGKRFGGGKKWRKRW